MCLFNGICIQGIVRITKFYAYLRPVNFQEMKKIFVCVLAVLALISCNTKEDNNLMKVEGSIEGLKKGKIYFQRVEEGKIINIDSIQANGNGTFSFQTSIESPEIFYIYLDKNDGNNLNDRLLFFGEPGSNITINSTRDFFEPNAKVEGSETNKKLVEYKKMVSKFSDKNLELIEKHIRAIQDKNFVLADSLKNASDRNALRRYLYSLNFAINNKESYIAPYIALSEVFDAQLKYLDTINNSLTPEVANSKYGQELAKYIEELKKEQNEKE